MMPLATDLSTLFITRVKQVSSLRNYSRDSLITYVSGGSGLMVVENLLGGPFQEVLKDHSIAFEPSPPYTPEFNGVADFFFRDIVSMGWQASTAGPSTPIWSTFLLAYTRGAA